MTHNSRMKKADTPLMLCKLLAWYITHQARMGGVNTFPPHPSLPIPGQIMQHDEPELHGYLTLTPKTSPKNSQPCHASLQQCLVSISLFGCQLLSAHAQVLFCLPKNWANLFNISTDQGKNNLKKERLNLGTLFLGELVMDLSLFPSSRPQHS